MDFSALCVILKLQFNTSGQNILTYIQICALKKQYWGDWQIVNGRRSGTDVIFLERTSPYISCTKTGNFVLSLFTYPSLFSVRSLVRDFLSILGFNQFHSLFLIPEFKYCLDWSIACNLKLLLFSHYAENNLTASSIDILNERLLLTPNRFCSVFIEMLCRAENHSTRQSLLVKHTANLICSTSGIKIHFL